MLIYLNLKQNFNSNTISVTSPILYDRHGN